VSNPPSTVFELGSVLIGYDQTRERTMQRELGPSEIGAECVAQIARKLAGSPRKPITTPMWAPFQGTAVHAEMEQVLAYWNAEIGRERWLSERKLQIDENIVGHGDAYDTDHQIVVDWKHSGTTTRRAVLAAQRKGLPTSQQVKQLYRVQTHLYGFGYEQLGYPVKWVRVVFLPRSWQFKDAVEWTEAYDKDLVDWALKRYDTIRNTLAVLDVANHRERISLIETTPGDECAWCPFNFGRGETTWLACAGDTARRERIAARETAGLIA
jgi:hypothetical protein